MIAAVTELVADDPVADAVALADLPLIAEAERALSVELRDVVPVRQRVRNTEAWASFTSAVARRLGEAVEQAKAELAETKHQVWTPVLERGVELRIAAARRVDRARLAAQWGRSHSPQQVEALEQAKAAAFDAAKPLFDAGNEIIGLAVRNGERFPTNNTFSQPQWHSREANEREFWRKPVSQAELADAVAS
jgi:hypothetical protein